MQVRPELIGREVAVDDRIASFEYRQGFLRLKRTPVLFRLPPRLRYEQAPRDTAAARLQGVLRREGEQ